MKFNAIIRVKSYQSLMIIKMFLEERHHNYQGIAWLSSARVVRRLIYFIKRAKPLFLALANLKSCFLETLWRKTLLKVGKTSSLYAPYRLGYICGTWVATNGCKNESWSDTVKATIVRIVRLQLVDMKLES